MKNGDRIRCFTFFLCYLFSASAYATRLPIVLYQAIGSTLQFVLIGSGHIDAEHPSASSISIQPHTSENDFFVEPESDIDHTYSWDASQPVEDERKGEGAVSHPALRLKLRRGTQPEDDLFQLAQKCTSSLTRTTKSKFLEDDSTVSVEMTNHGGGFKNFPIAVAYQFTSDEEVTSLSYLLHEFYNLEELPFEAVDVFDDIFYTCRKADMKFYFAKDTDHKTLVVKIITLNEQRYLAAIGQPLTTKAEVFDDSGISSPDSPRSRSSSPARRLPVSLPSNDSPPPFSQGHRGSIGIMIHHPLIQSTKFSRSPVTNPSIKNRYFIPADDAVMHQKELQQMTLAQKQRFIDVEEEGTEPEAMQTADLQGKRERGKSKNEFSRAGPQGDPALKEEITQ
ncbi:hypothetical protein M3P05_03020 [Sansalvadorimonas sp. 2012CJ34-2]|uniref:Uncharacterized protein n=1 Tax=Parendozoicomonas callyspongiae TaxID=2942213 RepID=A0ABT0PC13_9GAMM|nr:hypothetical protein [Sansalvadorimonas sp. 2012CJ34-2]MCL6268923.1 hypothetical protein [Sansalvadorimonas sp. 2012CJ34-2]